ncbi:unnamed protein product [Cladocopium goreaui]|uniref:Sodium channel protein type 11 subunit alpha n=1 Tax=Cladocopium goreaui TaxID=2562237 RepID=A0A9P1D6C0_9DINO|nr:unnamed protein product [Cladocopium goreaui]
MRQKALTHLVDEESRRASSTAFRALLRSEAEPGARAFLAARRGGPTRMDSAFFVAELRHRLQIPEATSDKWWPLCNASSTLFHCMLARVARREKTLRHTAVRDALFRWADRPNLQPEKERPGLLLPQRPDDLANQLPTSSFPASPVSPLLLTWPSRGRVGFALSVAAVMQVTWQKVFSSLLEFALELQMHQEDSSSNAFSNMRLLRVLRVAKVTRALRIVRVVKFVRSLKSLLFCIGRTLRALAWSLVLLMLIVFVFGLIFTDITSEYLTQTDTVVDPITAGTLRTRFGGLELSMHTLYGSITGGFTWVEARDAFGEISFVWGILFEGYISFCLFAVLNVMTGVFCHSAIESADKDHEMNLQILATEREKYFRAVKRLFARLDADADGGITATEFEVALQDKTLISVFDALEISVGDAWNLFRTLDSDGDSHVGPQEFIDGCLRLKGPARSIDVVCIKRDLNTLMQKLDTQVEEMTHIKKKITRAD